MENEWIALLWLCLKDLLFSKNTEYCPKLSPSCTENGTFFSLWGVTVGRSLTPTWAAPTPSLLDLCSRISPLHLPPSSRSPPPPRPSWASGCSAHAAGDVTFPLPVASYSLDRGAPLGRWKSQLRFSRIQWCTQWWQKKTVNFLRSPQPITQS